MPDKICAYCKLPEILTREHLWPAALHRRLMDANQQSESAFWLSRLQKDIPNEPQIRDVCAQCNNGVLSGLDSYICTLFDLSFAHLPVFNERILFEFDYHLLKRWLLKMSFNSARIHKSNDLFAIEALLPYILGEDLRLGGSARLYVQLSHPQEVPTTELSEQDVAQKRFIFKPTGHRAGHLFFRVPGVGQKLLRHVHLRAFGFFIAFFKPGERPHVIADFEQFFLEPRHGITLLNTSDTKVQLVCNGVGAWESFRASRSNKIVAQQF